LFFRACLQQAGLPTAGRLAYRRQASVDNAKYFQTKGGVLLSKLETKF